MLQGLRGDVRESGGKSKKNRSKDDQHGGRDCDDDESIFDSISPTVEIGSPPTRGFSRRKSIGEHSAKPVCFTAARASVFSFTGGKFTPATTTAMWVAPRSMGWSAACDFGTKNLSENRCRLRRANLPVRFSDRI
jgi:hypothetical protein